MMASGESIIFFSYLLGRGAQKKTTHAELHYVLRGEDVAAAWLSALLNKRRIV
jgi:hypothetical protein